MEQFGAAALETGLDDVRCSPVDGGRLELIVARPAAGERTVLVQATLDVDRGLVGDDWLVRPSSPTPDRAAHPEMQVTMMNARVAALVAGSAERRALAGDQLYVDLDLSESNLPAGTRLAIGSAVIAVTTIPHRGCAKFSTRFGSEALRFVNTRQGLALRLRGVNTTVVVGGIVRTGDLVTRLGS